MVEEGFSGKHCAFGSGENAQKKGTAAEEERETNTLKEEGHVMNEKNGVNKKSGKG